MKLSSFSLLNLKSSTSKILLSTWVEDMTPFIVLCASHLTLTFVKSAIDSYTLNKFVVC